MKTYVYTETCTQMFMATLFRIAKNWKQPKCPSTGEWIDKMWSVSITEDYSAIKRSEVLIHTPTWMDHEC